MSNHAKNKPATRATLKIRHTTLAYHENNSLDTGERPSLHTPHRAPSTHNVYDFTFLAPREHGTLSRYHHLNASHVTLTIYFAPYTALRNTLGRNTNRNPNAYHGTHLVSRTTRNTWNTSLITHIASCSTKRRYTRCMKTKTLFA